MKLRSLLPFLLLLLSGSAFAQQSLTESLNSFTEDFTSLPTAASTPWADNSTLTNWYSNRTTIIGGTGSGNSGGLYSFGPSTGSDRALGSLGSTSANPVLYGVRIKNDGTTDIVSLTISYTGEQWRAANTSANTTAFEYQVSSSAFTDITSGAYTPFTALDFTSPNLTSVGAVDGNDVANSASVSATLTVNIPAGSEIMLRWVDIDNSGADHGLSIDDLTVTATYICTPPTASISGSTSICSGSSTSISFTGTPNAIVSYDVNGGATQNITLDGSGNATLPTGSLTANTTYNILSADNGSCSQPLTGSAVVTILPLPTVAISGSGAVCSGQGANITFTGTANATVTYTINNGPTQTVTLDGTGSATVATGNLTSTASYDVVSVSDGTCSQSLTGNATVTVNPLPTATVSGPVTVCSGDAANITFNGTANATVTYTINGGPNQTVTLDGTGNAIVNTGSLSANTTYALVDVNSGLCTSTLTGSAIITVIQPATASISGSTTIVPGSSAIITFTGTPNATVTYTIDGGPNQTITLDGSGNATLNTGSLFFDTDYDLVSVSVSGCSQTVTGTATITMTIPYGPIYTYTNDPTGAYDFVATNATGTNLSLLNGAIVSTSPCANGYTAEEFNFTVSYDPTTNAGVSATVVPDVNYALIITGFSIDVRRSANGPLDIRLAYSLDNGNNWTDAGTNGTPNNSTCDDVTTVTWSTAPFMVTNTTDGIMFAVFGFDAATSSGQLQILNYLVNGAVVPAPLPLTLTGFSANCNEDGLAFYWKSENETDVTSYAIERSTGKSFAKIASTPAADLSAYRLNVKGAGEGLYRLVSEYNNGVKQFSDVLNVKCGSAEVSVPASVSLSATTLNILPGSDFNSDAPYDVQVYNMNGQLVTSFNVENASGMARRQVQLVPGLYMVRLVQGSVTSSHKILRD